jgi:hypothetical protein
MPFGLVFRKAVLWHDGQQHLFRGLEETGRNRESMQWKFHSVARSGIRLEAAIDGHGSSLHRLPYIKTDCSGSFEVANNSLASASIQLERGGGTSERLETTAGAVLEMVG